jgi:hypothetical protein
MTSIPIRTLRPLFAVALGALALAGCGSSSSHSSTTSSTQSTAATPPPAVDELPAAERPSAKQFPPARGRSLEQLGRLVGGTAQLGAATGTFTPGTRRYAFALNAGSGGFIYAPTALYIAKTPRSRATGPYVAPADPMTVVPQYRSKQNTGPGGIKAIYSTRLPLPHKGTYTVLALTSTPQGMIGSPGEIAVAASSPIPDVGQRPPAINTDTLASVGGNMSLLTTRVPPEPDMHSVSLKDVLGKRPIVLLFSTPQLCVSKVCGPVTDIGVQLEREFGNRITFIHEEVYADNQPSKGFRAALTAFHLRTEPWLFTINRHGVIAARLEGSFGVNEFTQAIDAALR